MAKPFTGEYQYVSHNRQRGLSKKDKTPYDFASITLSDGLESIPHNLDVQLVEKGIFDNLKRGQNVEVVLECSEGYNRVNYTVTGVRVKQTV